MNMNKRIKKFLKSLTSYEQVRWFIHSLTNISWDLTFFFIPKGSAKKKCYDLQVVSVFFYSEWVNWELLTKDEIYDENSNKLEFCVNQPVNLIPTSVIFFLNKPL